MTCDIVSDRSPPHTVFLTLPATPSPARHHRRARAWLAGCRLGWAARSRSAGRSATRCRPGCPRPTPHRSRRRCRPVSQRPRPSARGRSPDPPAPQHRPDHRPRRCPRQQPPRPTRRRPGRNGKHGWCVDPPAVAVRCLGWPPRSPVPRPPARPGGRPGG